MSKHQGWGGGGGGSGLTILFLGVSERVHIKPTLISLWHSKGWFRSLHEIYCFAIPTCFSLFLPPDVCILCMGALSNMSIAECQAVCLVPCLVFFHELMKQEQYIFPHLSIPPQHPLPPFVLLSFSITLSIFCWSRGADRKVLCV